MKKGIFFIPGGECVVKFWERGAASTLNLVSVESTLEGGAAGSEQSTNGALESTE